MDPVATYREAITMAVQSLALHKTRSVLTMLGVIFGVGAVIAMLSIGEGARRESLEQIEVLGVRNIIIRSMDIEETSGDEEEQENRPVGISTGDALSISEICSFAERTAVTWESKLEARTYDGSMQVILTGTSPEYARIFNLKTGHGSFIHDYHLKSTSNVCVIGSDVRQALFGFKDPVGELIKLQDQWFRVIGVVDQKKNVESLDLDIPSTNAMVIIPLTTAMAKFPREVQAGGRFFRRRFRFSNRSDAAFLDRSTIDQIAVQVREGTSIVTAANIIGEILKHRHHDKVDFTVTIPEQLIEQSQKTQGIFNIVMGAIAGISLLVGGIGIMNIMLASVLERTREIGIRRAIGATRLMIVIQFLSEAALLSLLGGIGGIVVGWSLTGLITAYAGGRTIVSFWSILLAFSVAAATGILFGYYPAHRAAEEDVIEALRHE